MSTINVPNWISKASPQARWEANGFLSQIPESLEKLGLLLLTVARTRLVRRGGIQLQNMRYVDPTLAAYIGTEVVIRYDPRDMAIEQEIMPKTGQGYSFQRAIQINYPRNRLQIFGNLWH